MPTKPYKSATVLLQFGDIFPTPERHTSFRADNMWLLIKGVNVEQWEKRALAFA
jgi:hypothetical protein